MTVRSIGCTCDIFTPTGGSWTGYESVCCAPDCPEHGTAARRRSRPLARDDRRTRTATTRDTERGRTDDGWVVITPTGRATNQAATPARRRLVTLYELKYPAAALERRSSTRSWCR
jgi:hypothetical protein